ncbi:regulation of nuclear pre-mRNA domain-containing protein 2a [Lampris incognitus]|uniref:regulation of nuclear pre-mRNA domain-containing protein 2a n=1 Tax=Lampris incognitus TaxID=2546036 RepID=UPI0024B60AAF|nr:regulation of nuclear pre-mRNA domain-containing protein 2a [Lampris incognitus]
MAAGAGGSSGSMESTLNRKFQSISNTMESIQGLSTWCIEHKKYHSLIVRHWMKWLRKSDSSHRLNLIYLANDVIQNCKRKNAIVYRTAFAEVLPDAFLLVSSDGDSKMRKAVERILSIWEERSVYTGTLITELRGYLVNEESPVEMPVEQKTPVDNKAALRSKIVAEFVPQALIDQLFMYKTSVEEVELKEKQLAAMRVDVCSSDALKKLKDKAGGKKFSKDFEEGSAKLQDFVKFLDQQSKGGLPLLEVLGNADIFYEMQYQEVKIVANAYQTFANRVSHLKRKLDSLKATLPDLDESPIPSPSADAPSPTGSESPFHGLGISNLDPDLDGSTMEDEAEPPAPSPLSTPGASPKPTFAVGENDNREVEDMELSEDEIEGNGIIVEEHAECPAPKAVSNPVPDKSQSLLAADTLPVTQDMPPLDSPQASLANTDLGKISHILRNLTSVMTNTEPSVGTLSTLAAAGPSVKSTPPPSVTSQDTSSLVNLLSQVDMTPEVLLGTLSKTQSEGSGLKGLTSLLSSPVETVSSDSSNTGKLPPTLSSTPASAAPSTSQPLSSSTPVPSPVVSTLKQNTSSQAEASFPASSAASALVQALHRDMELTTEPEPSSSSQSLESKIHSFLQGNPGFSAFNLGFSTGLGQGSSNLSPMTGTDAQDSTPVRDEGGGTPTQDEIMDKPVVDVFTSKAPNTAGYQNSTWKDHTNPQQQAMPQNGQGNQPYSYGGKEGAKHEIMPPVAHYQPIPSQAAGPVPTERSLGNVSSNETAEDFQGVRVRGWYGSTYPEGETLHPRGHSVTAQRGGTENQTLGLYPYQTDKAQETRGEVPHQGVTPSPGFFKSTLPPVPQLPPPPVGFELPPGMVSSEVVPSGQKPMPNPETEVGAKPRVDSIIGGMVVHDHQHKSVFHHDDPLYHHNDLHGHPDDLHPHPDELNPHPEERRYHDDLRRYHDDLSHYHEDPHHEDPLLYRDDPRPHPDDPYYHPNEPRYRPDSPSQPYPSVRGRLTPPLSPSEGAFFDYCPRSPSPPPLYGHRGLRPPRPEMHYPGPHPLRWPVHPARPPHPHPRGPSHGPPFPPFRGPDPWLRGKRPGPRGRGPSGPVFPPKRPYLPPRY